MDSEISIPFIKVWRFADAPAEYRALSEHDGDEDWLAFVPVCLAQGYIPWLQVDAFNYGWASEHALPDGSVIRIWAHS